MINDCLTNLSAYHCGCSLEHAIDQSASKLYGQAGTIVVASYPTDITPEDQNLLDNPMSFVIAKVALLYTLSYVLASPKPLVIIIRNRIPAEEIRSMFAASRSPSRKVHRRKLASIARVVSA